MTQHQAELQKFLTLQEKFLVTAGFQSIDKYGFTQNQNPDILITALTHGNEVIGLQIVNLFLELILAGRKPNFTFAIQLNNIEAYLKDQRFVDKDLNRSFKSQKPSETDKNQEYHRAQEIEAIVQKLKPRFVLDLHQTTEPTLSPFFMLPETEELILAANTISTDWPIITFDANGFSKDGKTLMEYAWSEKIPSLVIEVSQNGFNTELATMVCNKIFNLDPQTIIKPAKKSNISYFKITHQITKQALGSHLIPGFKNLQPIKQNEFIGEMPNKEKYLCPVDGLFIFPKYGRQAEVSSELGLIATIHTL